MVRRQIYTYQFTYPIARPADSASVEVDVYMTSPAGRTVVRVQRNGSESMATWRARSVQATLWSKADRQVLSSIDRKAVVRKKYLTSSRVCTAGAHELVWIRAPTDRRPGGLSRPE